MRRAAAALLLAVVGAAVAGCATMQDFQNSCAAIGYAPGTYEFAGCVERERERHHQAVSDALNSWNNAIQQQNLINQMNRPRTCYTSGPYYARTTTCY